MCIMKSLSALAQPWNVTQNLVLPGRGEGFPVDLLSWEIDETGRPGVLCIPLMQGQEAERHQLATARISFTTEELESAARHAASLAPYDHLALKTCEEEVELDLALSDYKEAHTEHAQNETWSHVLSEAADVANTTAAWLLRGLPAHLADHAPTLVLAAAYRAAIIICRSTMWADRADGPIKVGGAVDWVVERLLDDVHPMADAVAAAMIAKTVEVAVRPHGGGAQ